jgi:hypothetical protein
MAILRHELRMTTRHLIIKSRASFFRHVGTNGEIICSAGVRFIEQI